MCLQSHKIPITPGAGGVSVDFSIVQQILVFFNSILREPSKKFGLKFYIKSIFSVWAYFQGGPSSTTKKKVLRILSLKIQFLSDFLNCAQILFRKARIKKEKKENFCWGWLRGPKMTKNSKFYWNNNKIWLIYRGVPTTLTPPSQLF